MVKNKKERVMFINSGCNCDYVFLSIYGVSLTDIL